MTKDTQTTNLIERMNGLSPQVRDWLLSEIDRPQPAVEAQQAFWKMMTVQRMQNVVAAADFYDELSEEARTWLLNADKKRIAQLESTIEFMHASKIIWKFIWVGGGLIVSAFAGFSVIWKVFGEFFVVKIK